MTNFLIRKFVKEYRNTEDPKVRGAYGKLSGFVGIVCNLILFGLKLFVGWLSASVSIMADAFNNLADASSSIISLIGFKLAERPADKDHPYGHGRYEYLSALVVAALVLVVGVELFKSSFDKILNPSVVVLSLPSILILCASVVMKFWMLFFNRRTGMLIRSQALLATAADCRNDAFTTVAVLLAAVISHFVNVDLDGYIGLAVSIFILISGVRMLKETIDPMLGSAPDAEEIERIRDKLLSYPGVLGMHDLMVHDYGPCRKFASVHIEMAAEEDVLISHDLIDNIEKKLEQELQYEATIHMDPVVTDDEELKDARTMVETIIHEENEGWKIHDFRMARGNTHTNLIFDLVVDPADMSHAGDIERNMKQKIHDRDSHYFAVIKVEQSYV